MTEELGQERLFFVAHDVSGPPMIHLAAHRPELVERMLLTETSIAGPEMGAILAAHINEIWHFPVNASRLAASFATGREEQFIPQFFTDWVYNAGAIGPDDIAEYVRIAKRPGSIECGAAYYHSPGPVEADGGPLPAKSLTMPILYIGAELGFGGWLGGAERSAFKTIERYATDIEYEVVDRCSHWVSEDRPVFLAERIADFFGG